MRFSKTLVTRLCPLLLALTLTGSHRLAWAQEDSATEAAPKTSTQKPAPPKETTPEKETTKPANNDSPFDYEASEEISQDLSVSFPVDI